MAEKRTKRPVRKFTGKSIENMTPEQLVAEGVNPAPAVVLSGEQWKKTAEERFELKVMKILYKNPGFTRKDAEEEIFIFNSDY